MATQTANITALYEDVVADLIPYFDNLVLLPNPQLIVNTYNIQGGVGNTMKIPVTTAWTSANSSIGDNEPIIAGASQDFNATAVQLQVVKRGAGTLISQESLEDGGFETLRNAVITRLSRSLAQATDVAGFRIMLTGSGAALTDISDLSETVIDDGYANTALTTADIAVVFSPEAAAYAMKREPTVKMFNDVDRDNYQMVATVRNGFAQVRPEFIRAISTSSVIGDAANVSASLDQFSTSVANLRAVNAPTDGAGFYMAAVTPAQELALAKQINGVGGITSGSIGSVSQDLANQALMEGLIGQAVGLRFVRSNNLPSGLATD